MSKKIIAVLILIIIVGIWSFGSNSRTSGDLVNPQILQVFSKQTPPSTPSPASIQAPKTFNFDKTTDLKVELEKINPQVLDSDFE